MLQKLEVQIVVWKGPTPCPGLQTGNEKPLSLSSMRLTIFNVGQGAQELKSCDNDRIIQIGGNESHQMESAYYYLKLTINAYMI